MPRKTGQKNKILLLLDYFERKTDEEHRVTVPQLLAWLEAQGAPAERKSVYSDIETLQQAGYDIIQVRGKCGGYYLAGRQFELPELKLLVDAVQASRFITRRKSEALIKKLESLASEYQASSLQRQVFVSGRVKNMNESIYYNVDDLHRAISQDKQVSFIYSDWNLQKQRQARRGGEAYHISPWGLAWESENYYLIGYEAGKGIRHYRVDRMSRLAVLRTPRQGREVFAQFDMAAYTRRMFGMYSGEMVGVQLRCKNSLVNVMLDRFGTEVTLLPQPDGEHFDLHIQAAVSPQFLGWLCGFGADVEIVAPETLRAQFSQTLQELLQKYQ